MGYEFLNYKSDDDGITTITLNRPPVNAFDRKMSGELIFALDRFGHAEDERVLMLTGSGRAFSTGEDLKNINLDLNDREMAAYAEKALRDYHAIVRSILSIPKPIIAALNGVAAGAGMSIALACDYRLAAVQEGKSAANDKVMVPAFADMGLIADSGMTATLPRLARMISARDALLLCEKPHGSFTIQEAKLFFGLLDDFFPAHEFLTRVTEYARELMEASPLAYGYSKEMRNKALIHELNQEVFPWEIRAQTACLQSEHFKQKAREFLAKQKNKPASAQ